jgi:tetratricopeptide (TPR) repeat protein
MKTTAQIADKQLKLRAGLATVRCAMTLDRRDLALEALRVLNRDFPRDPDVLYVSTHIYSDLSTRAAQELAMVAPQSYQAHQLTAEALEIQGKWDEAAKEYQGILGREPNVPGIHFRMGRLLLSKPNPGPAMAEDAKKEFEAELKIDPSNAGAEYVLGELAREAGEWGDAVRHFARATELDAQFGDAYLGLGTALIGQKEFQKAVSPLEKAVQLEPRNPAPHYQLATAYSRLGRKEDAKKEFAIHKQMTEKAGTEPQPPPREPSPDHN